jgi:hypothetical protein
VGDVGDIGSIVKARELAYTSGMNMRNQAQDTLASYIKAKLNCTLTEFSKAESVPVRTMQDRWQSDTGRTHIQNAVFVYYVKRFDEL